MHRFTADFVHRAVLATAVVVGTALAPSACGDDGVTSESPAAGDNDAGADDATLDAPTQLDAVVDGTLDVTTDGPVIDAGPDASSDPIAESLIGSDVPDHRLTMFYLVWHAPAATVMDVIASRDGGVRHTLEDVIRGGGALKYADVYQRYGVEAQAIALYYNVQPSLGYYCIYRGRTPDGGVVPDCPNISATLATHAAQLVAAGVDSIVVDATNLIDVDPGGGDLLQLRPFEVLLEEWAKLRAQGKKTPQIAIWNAVPKKAVQWQSLLALYQDPAYDGLLFRDKKSGKKVFFVVDSAELAPEPANVTALESAGLLVQRMWTLGKTDATLDRWAFMAACRSNGKETTSIVGEGPCDQAYTPKSSLGSAVAVAPSFQTGHGSLPLGAAGKLRGLTFQRQWATALSVMPDYVFVSGWNELVAQPQMNPFKTDPFAKSVGLERDPDGRTLFVDTFGAEYGRDIEPTVELGSATYDLLRSCARVYRKNVATHGTGCNDASEACCDPSLNAFYTNIFVLRNDGASDVLLTTSVTEKTTLVGAGWREVCARQGTGSIFCTQSTEPSTPLAPFTAFAGPGAGRHAIMRCRAGARHFYSLDATCEGQIVEGPLAYVADAPSGEMPRRAQRCYASAADEHTIALGFDCPAGTTDEGTLGYVR